MSTPNTHLGADSIASIMKGCLGKRIFFAGVGGVMMSSLALLTKRQGFEVKGSDRAPSAVTKKLEHNGIEVFYSHSAENLGDRCGALVYTVAISEDNPEYVSAKERGIPCISRADYLGYLMTEYQNRIGVAGMHGKSTCTSMCAEIFMSYAEDEALLMPTVISGAEYKKMGGAYYIGGKENFIFEACEYMDSFLDFNPTVAILLNAEMEHVDYFKSMEQINSSFAAYAALTGEGGVCIANADDENIMISTKRYNGRLITFGRCSKADYVAENVEIINGRPSFDVYCGKEKVSHIYLSVCGEHNVYNALAAALAANVCGIPWSAIEKGLANFYGSGRRMEYKGIYMGADVWDDYGHHPTEVSATLSGVRQMAGDRRVVCVFQPHTYSRTAALADKFAEAFASVDKIILADIYAARERNSCGISSKKLADMIGEKAVCGGDIPTCLQILSETVRDGDLVICMGAGDIFKIYSMMGLC